MLEVYARPRDEKRPLVCLGEFCKQLIADTRGPTAACPGQPARTDYEYERRGMCSAFMASSPLEQWRGVRVSGQRTARDWAQTIKWLSDEVYPKAGCIVLVHPAVAGSTRTHRRRCMRPREPREALRLKERIQWHHTPKHGSWLNMAEIEIGVAQRQCLNRRIATQAEVERELLAWAAKRNAQHYGTDWRFRTKDARLKLKRLYPSVLLE